MIKIIFNRLQNSKKISEQIAFTKSELFHKKISGWTFFHSSKPYSELKIGSTISKNQMLFVN